MLTFKDRSDQHNNLAIPLVESIFRQYGFESYPIGTETDDSELRKLLQMQDDPTSVMIRFRPDRVSIRPGLRSVLCEIKSESGCYPNYAVEIASYEAALLWNRVSKNVMFVFVDLLKATAVAAWADKLPEPNVIYVPTRRGYEDRVTSLKLKYPTAKIKTLTWFYGSGTPFMLVPKDHPCLISLDTFIRQELCHQPD